MIPARMGATASLGMAGDSPGGGSASDEVRRKLEVLVNLRLRDATLSQRPLRDVMREVSRNARRRGLTPEILQSILDVDP